jgi:hypothetical protein
LAKTGILTMPVEKQNKFQEVLIKIRFELLKQDAPQIIDKSFLIVAKYLLRIKNIGIDIGLNLVGLNTIQ